MDNCIICKSHLINKKQTIRSRMRDKNGKPQGDMIRYKAWCPKCEIYLWKTKQGKTEGHWRISMVKESDKITEICESEFLKIKYNLEKELENIDDKFMYERESWIEFIVIKKQNDKIYEFSQIDNDYTIRGYTIKRDNYFIGDYITEIKKNFN